jgi:hypothetical protein
VDNSEYCGNGVAGKIVFGKDDLSPTVVLPEEEGGRDRQRPKIKLIAMMQFCSHASLENTPLFAKISAMGYSSLLIGHGEFL